MMKELSLWVAFLLKVSVINDFIKVSVHIRCIYSHTKKYSVVDNS